MVSLITVSCWNGFRDWEWGAQCCTDLSLFFEVISTQYQLGVTDLTASEFSLLLFNIYIKPLGEIIHHDEISSIYR